MTQERERESEPEIWITHCLSLRVLSVCCHHVNILKANKRCLTNGAVSQYCVFKQIDKSELRGEESRVFFCACGNKKKK